MSHTTMSGMRNFYGPHTRSQGEKFSTKPTTDVELWASGRWVRTRTGVGVTSSCTGPQFHIGYRLDQELFILPTYEQGINCRVSTDLWSPECSGFSQRHTRVQWLSPKTHQSAEAFPKYTPECRGFPQRHTGDIIWTNDH